MATGTWARVDARALVLLFLAAACSPSVSSSVSPSPSAPGEQWVPQTAWERAVIDVDENGAYSKDAALTLFATAYGPLPGVDVAQDLTGVSSRTLAIRAVSRVRDELTDEQQAAVDAYLEPPADAITIEIPPVASLSPWRLVRADTAVEQALREMAEEVRMDIAAKMGDFEGFLRVSFLSRPASVQPIDGLYPNGGSQPQYDVAGAFQGCKISIYHEATDQPGLQLTVLVSHETFHCFQQAIHKTQAVHDNAPHWISEGQATWVGLDLGGPSPNYVRFWDRYLLQPWLSLAARGYDAVGFYAHLAEIGVDPWTVFRPMLEAGTDSLAAYKAAGANAEAFVDSWASGVLREGALGTAWNINGIGITASAYTPVTYGVQDGTDYPLGQPYFSNDIDTYDLQSDMVQIEIDGHARLRDGNVDMPIHGSVLFCVEGHDCAKKCPDGSDPPQTQGTVAARITLAESGGSEGLVGHIRGMNIDADVCSPPPSEEPTDGAFCDRYRDYVAWAEALGPDTDVTQEIAREIARRFKDMHPVAPDELRDDVVLVFAIYATFGHVEEPWNVPGAGHIAGPTGMARLPGALKAMHAYCGIPWPAF